MQPNDLTSEEEAEILKGMQDNEKEAEAQNRQCAAFRSLSQSDISKIVKDMRLVSTYLNSRKA